MRPRRAARRLLDPWAGLLYAALIVLAVVILSATPAPWRAVGEEAPPVTLADAPPSDLAVFVLGSPAKARCTAVVWLHVERDPARLTAVLVPVRTLCAVPGGGFAPIGRLVTDAGPVIAAGALSDALGVEPVGWVTLERLALVRLLGSGRAPGGGREGTLAVKAAVAAFSSPAGDETELRRQSQGLARSLRSVPYAELNANALVNYALGSAEVESDLDLRAASALAAAFRALRARDVAVAVAPAIVEFCGGARSWTLDEDGLERLRVSFTQGRSAAAGAPSVETLARSPEVILVAPPGLQSGLFAEDLQAALAESGARPVVVRSVSLGGDAAAARLAVLLERRRPLAVVLVPGGVGNDTAAAQLTAMTEVVRVARQPAVVALASPAGDDETITAALEGGLPVVTVADPSASSLATGAPPAGVLSGDDEARRRAARLVVATVVRACWPEYLAPALPGTRLEFSYAARRATAVAIVGGDAAQSSQRLTASGWEIIVLQEDWTAPPAPAIVHLPDARRAALTLAGDLGWPGATLVPDPSAPADVVAVAWPE